MIGRAPGLVDGTVGERNRARAAVAFALERRRARRAESATDGVLQTPARTVSRRVGGVGHERFSGGAFASTAGVARSAENLLLRARGCRFGDEDRPRAVRVRGSVPCLFHVVWDGHEGSAAAFESLGTSKSAAREPRQSVEAAFDSLESRGETRVARALKTDARARRTNSTRAAAIALFRSSSRAPE